MEFGRYYPDDGDAQTPADVAVITVTIGRPTLLRAIRSVYAQRDAGRVRLMLGVHRMLEQPDGLGRLLNDRPPHVSVAVLRLPWSTSVRYGGVHTPADGGALRAMLSYMANARRLAYLDDDNSWTEDHLHLLRQAMDGKAWAWSRRMLVDSDTDEELGVDEWDSVGPNRGVIHQGGIVDTAGRPLPTGHVDVNCLMVDPARVAHHLGHWAQTLDGRLAGTADRRFFLAIAGLDHEEVSTPTVRYGIRPDNTLHYRLRAKAAEGAQPLPEPR